jgi:toxin ParE1/3/4
VKLRYTLRGAAELDEALAYIEARSPQGARRVQTRIQVIINLLLRHPHADQLTSTGRLRRMIATPYPYLIFYRRPRTRL